MPSTYSPNLKIELQANGENAATWGDITNLNLGTALEQAIVGYATANFTSDANLTLTLTNSNSAQTARALVLNATSAVNLTTTRELIVPTIQKQYIVQNNTLNGQSITVKTSAGSGVTIPNGRKMHVYVDGTNVIQMFDFQNTLTISGALTVSGGLANSIAYLNGSKQLTTSSGLTYDGTSVNLGGSGSGARLVVRGTGSTSATHSIEAATSAGATRFLVSDDGLTRWYGTTNAETMRLDNAGNLGIGTASPGGRLDVLRNSFGTTAAFRAYDGTNNPRLIVYGSASGTTLQHTFSSGSGNFMFAIGGAEGAGTEIARFNASGDFAIAEGNAPTRTLNIYRTGSTTTVMSAGNTNTGLDGTWFGVDATGNGIVNVRGAFPLIFSTSANERARIDSSGNFCIGTASAIGKLSVFNTGTGQTGFNAGPPSSPVRGNLWYDTDGTGWKFQIGKWQSSAFTAQMTFQDDGNVGIGTASPGTRLDVSSGGTPPSPAAGTVARVVNAGTTGTNSILSIVSGNTGQARVEFGRTSAAYAGRISYDNSSTRGELTISTVVGGVNEASASFYRIGGSGAGNTMGMRLGGGTENWEPRYSLLEMGMSGNQTYGVYAVGQNSFEDKNASIVMNAYYDTTNTWKYAETGSAAKFSVFAPDSGQGYFRWSMATNGTQNGAITMIDRMTLDSTGLGINQTNPFYALHVNADAGFDVVALFRTTGSNTRAYIQFEKPSMPSVAPRVGCIESDLVLEAGATDLLRAYSNDNIRIGYPSMTTTRTTGFVYIPTCPGTPTSTPTATISGFAPIMIDRTNHKLYFYSGGAWRDAGP